MATLRVRVIYPSAVLPDLPANEKRMFVFSGVGSNANGTGAFGNLGRKNVTPNSDRAYNFNNPMIAGSIAVTPWAAAFFDSHDIKNDQSLAGQMSYAIEQGFVEVVDMAQPGVPLSRNDLQNLV